MHITSLNLWGLPQAEGHSAPRAAYRDFFDSLSLTERVTVGTFGLELLAKDQPSDDPEFINRLRSPRLEDLPYYDDVIKAAAEAIEAWGKSSWAKGPK
ncbi:hypothetical protein LX32DRAFT_633931, partial [Colletotrichum zoysiae]